MATRKRVIYQSEYAFAGPSPASGLHYHPSGVASGNYVNELTRVQSAGHSFTVNRQDVNQFGQLAAIAREIIEAPTVSVDMNYYVTNGGNESKIGLNIGGQVSAISGLLNGTADERNLFLLTVGEGADAVGNSNRAAHEVVAIGNAFLSNYTVEAAVGQLANASVTFEALNINYELNSSGNQVPAIEPESGDEITGVYYVLPIPSGSTAGEVSAIRPGDIELELQTALGADVSGDGKAHLQSFSLTVPVAREPLDRLGSRFPFSREITFPVTVTLNATANVAALQEGKLVDLICEDQSYNLSVIMREPTCSGSANSPVALKYQLKGAKLDSQSFTSSIGANKSVDLVWSAQIGGPEDLQNGLFMSGSYAG